MKKFLSLMMFIALITSCSDDDSRFITNPDMTLDTQLVRSIKLYDVTGGDSQLYGVMDFTYNDKSQLTKVKSEEYSSKGAETKSITETMFTYGPRIISYSTIKEHGTTVDLYRGNFILNNAGLALKGMITDGSAIVNMKYNYDRLYHLTNTMVVKGRESRNVTAEWINGNISLIESMSRLLDGSNSQELERVEYNIYPNNAAMDLARVVCFGNEGGEGIKSSYGAREGNYLGCFSHRVNNMPSKMTSFANGIKKTKTFEYNRDRKNRIYEINVKKEIVYSNGQEENKDFKYVIVY